jgi:hypothetical protein
MRRIQVPCTIHIEHTAESLHAHAIPEGVDIQPGDQVLIHGAPSRVNFGESVSLQCTATIIRATILKRFWTQLTGLLEFSALYEVGFERRN